MRTTQMGPSQLSKKKQQHDTLATTKRRRDAAATRSETRFAIAQYVSIVLQQDAVPSISSSSHNLSNPALLSDRRLTSSVFKHRFINDGGVAFGAGVSAADKVVRYRG